VQGLGRRKRVQRLWCPMPFVTRAPRFVPALAVLAVAAFFVACDPVDEAPPPATALNAAAAPPPPEAPPGAGAPGDAPATESASPEYNVGEEPDTYGDDDPAALTDFHDTLAPYGEWVNDATYGTVWVPSDAAAGPDFRPYVSNGHWAYDDDWVWVSDYPWGWAPFHYGRWVVAGPRGWAWIPGRAYRGAWVTWGVDDSYAYLGWAPLPPLFVWFGGVPVAWRGAYFAPRWAYCGRHDVFAPGVASRLVTGPATLPVAERMHVYVAARAGGGPAPERLGFASSAVPRPTGAAAAGVARATQFARPSTAQPLGARPPSAPLRSTVAPVRSFAGPARALPGGATMGPSRATPAGAAALGPGAHPAAPMPARGATFGPSRGGAHFGGGGAHFGGGGHHR